MPWTSYLWEMNKIILAILLSIFFLCGVKAQTFKAGLSAGAGLTRDFTSRALLGSYNFGIPVRKEFTPKWTFESGVYYYNYKLAERLYLPCTADSYYSFIDYPANTAAAYHFQKLHLPFLADYNLSKGKRKTSVSINGGLGFSTYFSAKEHIVEDCNGDITTTNTSGLNLIKPLKISFLCGFNINYKLRENADLRLSYSYSKYFSPLTKLEGYSEVIIEGLGFGVLYKIGNSKSEMPELIKD